MKTLILALTFALCLSAKDKPSKPKNKADAPVVLDLETQNEVLASQMELKEAEKQAQPYNLIVDQKKATASEITDRAAAKCNPAVKAAADYTMLIGYSDRERKVVCVPRPVDEARNASPPQPQPAPPVVVAPAKTPPAAEVTK